MGELATFGPVPDLDPLELLPSEARRQFAELASVPTLDPKATGYSVQFQWPFPSC